MGSMRSEPETTKHSIIIDNTRFEVLTTGMCGWRKFMEDGHVCDINLGPDLSLLAVFDGHGGW